MLVNGPRLLVEGVQFDHPFAAGVHGCILHCLTIYRILLERQKGIRDIGYQSLLFLKRSKSVLGPEVMHFSSTRKDTFLAAQVQN